MCPQPWLVSSRRPRSGFLWPSSRVGGVQSEAVWAVQLGLPSGSWAWGSVVVRLPGPICDHSLPSQQVSFCLSESRLPTELLEAGRENGHPGFALTCSLVPLACYGYHWVPMCWVLGLQLSHGNTK